MQQPHHRALLVQVRSETPLLRHLTLEAPLAIRSAHHLPGQFIEVSMEQGGPGAYFALANPPGARHFELLVKQGEGVASQLFSLGAGRTVWLSAPMGPGFPLDEARGKDVLLFATGSGFAPIRALLHALLDEREAFGDVHLFFGVRREEDFPFREELDRLPARGVHTHLTVSRQPEGLRIPAGVARAGARSGHARYVQERFREVLPPVENAVAYLCGIEGMVEGVREALLEAGMLPGRIHVNL